MPRENKKRGRRFEAQKRKLDDHETDEQSTSLKRARIVDVNLEQDHFTAGEYIENNEQDQDDAHGRPFYGLLDEQEQEYFRRADDMLETNQFATPEERTLFLSNVFKEAHGKELKMACSQSCSRLFERLILASNEEQLKKLFQIFSGHFLNLVQHRFASHCCETLFIISAPVVSSDLASSSKTNGAVSDSSEVTVSMENLFLFAINELQGNLGFLLTDPFGSHALRVLLVVLSGQPLDLNSARSMLKSKRKEHIELAGNEDSTGKKTLGQRIVPQSFTLALENMMQESIAGLEPSYLQSLATHPVGNPMLQLLLHLDLEHFGKQHAKDESSIVHKLLPDTSFTEGTESANFLTGLVFDKIGSRLLETIIQDAPGKLFKAIYKDYFRDRIGSLARNEVAGYVVAKVLARLSKEDLQQAVDSIITQIPNLAGRGRTAIIRTLVERCYARGVDVTQLAAALQEVYTEDAGNSFSLGKLLNVPMPVEPVVDVSPALSQSSIEVNIAPSTLTPAHTPPPLSSTLPHSDDQVLPPMDKPQSSITAIKTTPSTLHASLLAQTMLEEDGPLSAMVLDAISKLSQHLILSIACTPMLSPILQKSLTFKDAPIMFRRKLIKSFYSHIFTLAVDSSGSHVVDAIWGGTQRMAFVRERVAEELAENEALLRDSPYGRKVWKNWRMDLYRRKRGEWVKKAREVGNDGFLSFPGGIEDVEKGKIKASITPSEAGAIRRSNKAPAKRHQSFNNHSPDWEGVSSSRGPGSSSGRLENGEHEKTKTPLDLAREKFVKSRTAINGSGQGQG